MSVQCPKCSKVLTRKQSLKGHLHKKLPCDFKCRNTDCDFQGKNRFAYYRHMNNTDHSGTSTSEQQTISPKVVIAIPGEDDSANNNAIPGGDDSANNNNAMPGGDDNNEDFQITPFEDFQIMVNNDEFDININIRAKTQQARAKLRHLIKAKTPEDLMEALEMLDDDHSEYLSQRLAHLLRVHINPKIPQLHNICMSDVARRSVSFYTRMSPVPPNTDGLFIRTKPPYTC